MEWVETTARSVAEAKSLALDQLGVAEDDAEFEVMEEPRPGLFGRVRGSARVRARVRPTRPRPRIERRDRRPRGGSAGGDGDRPARSPDIDRDHDADRAAPTGPRSRGPREVVPGTAGTRDDRTQTGRSRPSASRARAGGNPTSGPAGDTEEEQQQVDAQQVGAEAQKFVSQLVDAFGLAGEVEVTTNDNEIEVRVVGDDLGLLVGPRGTTLLAIQDLVRVAAQRRLGDHETRLRLDIAGYRARRREALGRFAAQVADDVAASGVARALEAMPSADRKVIHDVLTDDARIATHSEGDDPFRRVVIAPADA